MVVATAYVAEISAAPALHVVAAFSFFDPHGALWTLLEFGALHKLLKSLVQQIRIPISLKLLAGLLLVRLSFAIQAIFFLTLDALEIFAVPSFIKHKGIVAVRSGTPGDVSLFG